MAMRQTDYASLEGDIIYPARIPYQPPMKIPDPPKTQIEHTRFLGLQDDAVDTESKRRKKELHHAAVETSYRRMAAMALDVANHRAVTHGMSVIENHHNNLPPASLTQRVSSDIASGIASRQVMGTFDDGEIYTSISSNVLVRRR